MSGRRRLTAQGAERKQQLLDCAATLFAERGLRGHAGDRHRGRCRRGQGPLLLVLREQGRRLRRAGHLDPVVAPLAQREGIDRTLDPLSQLPPGHGGVGPLHGDHAHLYALLQAEGPDQRISELLRQGTQVHAADTATLIQRASPSASCATRTRCSWPTACSGSVTWFCHFHRTGRITESADDLATFVGRYVVRSVAADGVDESATVGLADIARPAAALGS
jgi:hypothetical protein